MTKTEFIKQVSHRSGVPQEDVRCVLNAMIAIDGVLPDCMLQGGRVVLPGFGVFHTSWVGERDFLHPKTGQRMTAPPRLRMHFKPGAPLDAALKSVNEPDSLSES